MSAIVDGNHFQHNALLVAQQLPGHNVAVMLHFRNNHLVAFLQKGFTKTARHQIQAFGGATRENDFGGGTRIDEIPHHLTGIFVQLRGLLRKEVHSPVHIGIDRAILIADGINHTPRFLRGGSIVKIHQRLSIHLTCQDGKILSYFVN